MQLRAREGQLVGYDSENGHIFRIWISETGKIICTRDATFNEDVREPLKLSNKDDHELEDDLGATIVLPATVMPNKGVAKSGRMLILKAPANQEPEI